MTLAGSAAPGSSVESAPRPFATPGLTPSGKKILIVDDSVVILKALSMKLKTSGYGVVTAEDGNAAIAMAQSEKPDLILLDLNFPPLTNKGETTPSDGFMIMAWLRQMEESRHIPIIVITSGAPEQYKSQALAAGAVGFFQKPLDQDQLLAAIRNQIGGRSD